MSSDHADRPGLPSKHDQGTTTGQDELAGELSQLARTLQSEDDLDAVLNEVVSAAVALIPGVDEGSISVVTARRHVTSQSPSSDLPRRVDALQAETGEGPCLDAVFEEETVRVPDMANEQRWPHFAPRAAAAGAAGMLSFQLFVHENNLGALNLYSREPNVFTDESEHIGLLFASHAAIAFAGAQKIDHLSHAMLNRDLIGQAKGILMERYQLTSDQAFRALTRLSQQHQRKLYDVAEELVRSRQLPRGR